MNSPYPNFWNQFGMFSGIIWVWMSRVTIVIYWRKLRCKSKEYISMKPMNTKKVVLLLLNVAIVLCTNTLSIAHTKGTFSFGFATDRTEQKYDVSGGYGSSFEVSTGYQMTFGGFYKEN